MHVETFGRYKPEDEVYVYMNWYVTHKGEKLAEFYLTDFTDAQQIDEAYFICYGKYADIRAFANTVPADATIATCEFLWNVYTASLQN